LLFHSVRLALCLLLFWRFSLGGLSEARAADLTAQLLAEKPLAPPAPPPGKPPAPRYVIVGYEQREEVLGDAEWRRLLGPMQYRQWVASRVLLALGGLVSFGGAMALVVTLGSVAGNTDYGRRTIPVESAPAAYAAYSYGFGGMLAAGGAMVAAGLIVALPLPSRQRTMLFPRLQRAPQGL
jgi:hypothetical protein